MRKHGSRSSSAVAETPAPVSVPEPVSTAFVVVDYPQEKEVVTSFEYTLRIGASPDAERVEVSFDGGEWQPCRPAVGYWWYDWSGYTSKVSRQVAARLTTRDGNTAYSLPRKFSVRHPKAAGTVAAKPATAKTPRSRKKAA